VSTMSTDRNSANGRMPDPAGEMRFFVKIGTEPIGRFSDCGGLGVEYDVFPWEEGGLNDYVHQLRGRARYPKLTLKRGVTHEDALLKWFMDCRDRAKRFDVTVTLMSHDNQTVRSWTFLNAFPSKWTGPTFNASSNKVAVETLEIVHEGFKV
jgi:phage tail-like protein